MTEDTNDSQMPFIEDTVLPAANTVYLNQQDKERLTVDIDGYEGPLDVLLSLARVQKVDLKQISILELAEQYLVFIKDAYDLKIELAADYLVMASWLAYLKSRLLLPANEDEEELSAEDMANRLVFQLQKLESMREASTQLMNRPQLGKDMFKRGNPEGIRIKRRSQYHASLYDLLGSYSTQRLRNYYSNWKPKELDVFTIERARQRLEHMLGKLDDWDKFDTLVLKNIQSAQKRRTMTASSLSAILEFVRDGRMEIHQDKNFGEILVRRARPKTATI